MAPIRPATDADWHAMFGFQAPPEWFGYVSETKWMRLGIGGVWKDADGRWWMFLERVPGVRMTKTAHSAAMLVIERLGAQPVYARGDPNLTGSCEWIKRLGFVETSEQIDGIRVWGLNTQP